jgi:antitoxin VapB
MNLQIRDPRARDMASRLARIEKTTMSQAVVDALNDKLKRLQDKPSISEIVADSRARLAAIAKPGGHMMTKEEIDDMWGQ